MNENPQPWIHRYFPTGIALLAAGCLSLVWFGPIETPYWLVVLNAVAVVFAAVVQIEAIYRSPEQYPEVFSRVE